MQKQLIEAIKAGPEPLDDELFLEIFEITDQIEQQKFIEQVRNKCREQKKLTEFNNMLKAWTSKNAQNKKQQGSNKTKFTDGPLVLNCGQWEATDTGICKTELSGKGVPYKLFACPHPILPVERLVNIDTNTEKLRLAFFKDDRWQYVTVDCTTCYNKQNITVLGDRGVMVTSETAKNLVCYLSDVVSLNMKDTEEGKAIPLYRSIARLGWIGNDFCPYVQDVKYDGDLDFESIYNQVRTAGSRQAWYDMAGEIRKDIVVRLLLATSLASPLIERVGALPFVFHLWGTTSFGKTVSLMVAMSVWGNPESGCLTRSMNMTQNAMARTASFLYNLPFGADELQQIRSRWDNFDNLIMYLTEGIDKGRAKARGGIEELKTWRNCFIFTGEEPVTKDNSGGGTKNRVIEVEVTKPIYESGYLVANTIRENYGWAGKEFIEYVKLISVEELRARYKLIFDEIMQKCDTTDKQAYSMALILLADELSCSCIFPQDRPIQVEDIRQYLHSNKAVDIAERAYEWCINWIARNQNRFSPDQGGEIWGKIEKDFALVNKEVLVEQLRLGGFEYGSVSRKWAENGYIIRDKDGGLRHRASVYGTKASYVKINLVPDERTGLGVVVSEPIPKEFEEQEIQW